MSWLEEIAWNKDGLVAAIACDYLSKQVLTLAWMNKAALEATVAEDRAVYWSRSRGKLWRKGEQSGHIQKVKEIRLDCDSDALVLMVEQIGGIACHTGRAHCFYKKLIDGQWVPVEEVLKDPKEIYSE